MKKLARNLVASILASLARGVLRKYRPTVVMVTGSVGKTSTKDAVGAALSKAMFVRASEKSNNSEFGVPLTILGAKNPWTDPFGWVRVFLGGLGLLWLPSAYPRTLVLEVGADSPGDIARILEIATPDAVVLTRLPAMPVHVEAYATPDAVREEEFTPALALPAGAPLILSSDDEYACALAASLPARIVSFGLTPFADVQVSGPELVVEGGKPVGMRAVFTIRGEEHSLTVKDAIGSPQLLAPAAAIAAAIGLGIEAADALKGLETYLPPPGRARLLRGKEGSILIDDTYNASPAAMEEALASLDLIAKRIPGTRRIAVLGDMLELGRYSQDEHERIGKIAGGKCDVLVTIGPRAHAIATAARAAGMPEENVRSFETAKEAAPQVAMMVKGGDAVLVKGSQSIRTERVVEALLADSADRAHMVRQEFQWKRR